MDIAETMRRARARDAMVDRFKAHRSGAGRHSMRLSSDWSQVFCLCGLLFTERDGEIIEEEVAALMDG